MMTFFICWIVASIILAPIAGRCIETEDDE